MLICFNATKHGCTLSINILQTQRFVTSNKRFLLTSLTADTVLICNWVKKNLLPIKKKKKTFPSSFWSFCSLWPLYIPKVQLHGGPRVWLNSTTPGESSSLHVRCHAGKPFSHIYSEGGGHVKLLTLWTATTSSKNQI